MSPEQQQEQEQEQRGTTTFNLLDREHRGKNGFFTKCLQNKTRTRTTTTTTTRTRTTTYKLLDCDARSENTLF